MFFEHLEHRADDAVGIFSHARYMEDRAGHPVTDLIGILIPEPQGFRIVLSKPPYNDDPGGGLVVQWNGEPIALRFDLVGGSQQALDLWSSSRGKL